MLTSSDDSEYDADPRIPHPEGAPAPSEISTPASGSPPLLISVMGPPMSGKTAIASAILNFFLRRESEWNGLVTFRTARDKGYSLYKCPSGITESIDAIKVSDLVLITLNVSAGLEKETLEIITMINSHGLTRLAIVLTGNIPRLPPSSRAALVKRISSEFSFPIKFFDFAEGKLEKLVRFIETEKIRPVHWKTAHPHVVVDRSRDGWLYGHVRGRPLTRGTEVHVPGMGDYALDAIEPAEDGGPAEQEPAAITNGEASRLCSLTSRLTEADQDIISLSGRSGSESPRNPDSCSTAEDECVSSSDSSHATERPRPPAQQGILEDVKKRVLTRFRLAPKTEEEFQRKFQEDYENKQNRQHGTSATAPSRAEAQRREYVEYSVVTGDIFAPGTYVRVKLPLKYNPRQLLILGGCLVGEMRPSVLSGKVKKSRWLTSDLKSNAPYFFSIGWCRFQSLPLFARDGKLIKYLRSALPANFSEIVLFGPTVPAGTAFFLFSTTGRGRILGTGQVLDAAGGCGVKKKLKLVGYPTQITGNNVIVESMFSSAGEASRFVNARISSVSGLRGVLKTPVGHSGMFRATFEGPILKSEILFIKTYVPIEPLRYFQPIVEGADYVRSLRDLKIASGLQLYDADDAESSAGSEVEFESEVEEMPVADRPLHGPLAPGVRSGASPLTNELRRLERAEKRLPFAERTVTVRKEAVDLPVPPEQRAYEREARALGRLRQAGEQAAREREERSRREKSERAERQEGEAEARRKKNAIEHKQRMEMGGGAGAARIIQKKRRK